MVLVHSDVEPSPARLAFGAIDLVLERLRLAGVGREIASDGRVRRVLVDEDQCADDQPAAQQRDQHNRQAAPPTPFQNAHTAFRLPTCYASLYCTPSYNYTRKYDAPSHCVQSPSLVQYARGLSGLPEFHVTSSHADDAPPRFARRAALGAAGWRGCHRRDPRAVPAAGVGGAASGGRGARRAADPDSCTRAARAAPVGAGARPG